MGMVPVEQTVAIINAVKDHTPWWQSWGLVIISALICPWLLWRLTRRRK